MKRLSYLLVIGLIATGIFWQSPSLPSEDAVLARKAEKQMRIKEVLEYEQLIRGEIDKDEHGNVIESSHEKYPEFNAYYELEKAKKRIKRSKAGSTATITERGPGNFSGRVTSVVYDPNNLNTFYAGTAGGGVYKSTDRGNNWTVLTDQLSTLIITQVALSKANSNVIYAGTGDPFGSSGSGSGIFKSTDAGQTWQILSATLNSNFARTSKIIVNPANENHLVVSTTTGIYYSTNGGSTFSTALSNKTTDLEYTSSSFNVQFAAVQGQGIYRSTNGGQSWSSVLNVGGGRGSLAVSHSNSNVAYFMYSNSSSMSKFYKTSNGGQSWSSVSQSGSEKNVFAYPQWPSINQGWYDQSLAVDPYNENVFFAGGIYFYKGTVSGSSVSLKKLNYFWSDESDASSTSYLHVDQHDAVTLPRGNGTYDLLIGCDGGFSISYDKGANFNEKTSGLRCIQFYSAQRHPSQIKFLGGSQDNAAFISGTNPSPTSSWTESVRSGDAFGSVWSRTNGNRLMTSGYNGNLYRSTNGGSSFSQINAEFKGSGPFVTFIGSTPKDGDRVVFSAGNKVYVSNNFGSSWTGKTMSRTTRFNNASVNKISEANANYIWVADYFGSNAGPFRSTNGGSSFTHVSNVPSQFNSGTNYVSGIGTHPTDPNTAYFLFSYSGKPHIVRTTDGGQTWTDLSNNNGFPNVPTYALKVLDNTPNEIWVGTEIGLFISTDNGASWSYADNGVPAVKIREITQIGDQIILATYGRGVYTADLDGTPITVNAPSSLSVSNPTSESLQLSWTDNSNNEDGFKIERRLSGSSFSQIATVGANVTSFTNTGLYFDTQYTYRVRAYKASTNSNYSNEASGTTSGQVSISAPSNLQVQDVTTTSISLSWTDNSDNESGFKIVRSSSENGTYSEVGTVGANTTTYTNSGLSSNTSYYYKVRAYNSQGNSGFSNSIMGQTNTDGQEVHEPNDSFSQAYQLSVGTTTASFIQSNGDEDYFKFSIPSGGSLKLTLGSLPADYDFFLYNNSQTELARGYSTNNPEIINHNPTSGGTFYVRVNGWNGAHSSTDSYELTITYTPTTSNPEWHYIDRVMETTHNYANNTNITQTYSQPGAQRVAVYFSRFETEANYDFVYIKDKNGVTKATHHGTKSAFWAVVDGDKIDVNFVSDEYVVGYGYKINRVAYYSDQVLSVPGVISGDQVQTLHAQVDGHLVHINNTKGNEIDVFAEKRTTTIPEQFSLHEAFPNPFNPETTIRFDLSEQSNVSMEVYNSVGQKVRTLISNQAFSANQHKVRWNATNDAGLHVPSGVYFIRLQAGHFKSTTKVVLLK